MTAKCMIGPEDLLLIFLAGLPVFAKEAFFSCLFPGEIRLQSCEVFLVLPAVKAEPTSAPE